MFNAEELAEAKALMERMYASAGVVLREMESGEVPYEALVDMLHDTCEIGTTLDNWVWENCKA